MTRSPICLTTISDRIIPPSFQNDAICGIIAATNIESISSKTMWFCTSDGLASTDPCFYPVWSGVSCNGGSIVQLEFNNVGLTGIFIVNNYIVIITLACRNLTVLLH